MQNIAAFGMQRSGNHAIVRWLARNFGGQSVLIVNNNAVGKPYETTVSVELDGRRITRKTESAELDELQGQLPDFDRLILSYENPALEKIANGHPIAVSKVDQAREFTGVLIQRDFCNWLSSSLKLVKLKSRSGEVSSEEAMTKLVDMWWSNIRNGETLCDSDEVRFIKIRYDRWFADTEYRLELLDELDVQLEHQNNDLPDVAAYGGGSSFDHLRKANVPETMDVLNRWRLQADDPLYRFGVQYALSDADRANYLQSDEQTSEILQSLEVNA